MVVFSSKVEKRAVDGTNPLWPTPTWLVLDLLPASLLDKKAAGAATMESLKDFEGKEAVKSVSDLQQPNSSTCQSTPNTAKPASPAYKYAEIHKIRNRLRNGWIASEALVS